MFCKQNNFDVHNLGFISNKRLQLFAQNYRMIYSFENFGNLSRQASHLDL